jgi:rhodanese-related sulfurtransferase
MKMMDCLALETLVVNHEPVELIDVRSKKEFAAMHIPGARSVPFGVSWRRQRFFEGGVRQQSAFMSFPPAVTLEPASQRGFCDRPVA